MEKTEERGLERALLEMSERHIHAQLRAEEAEYKLRGYEIAMTSLHNRHWTYLHSSEPCVLCALGLPT